MNDVDSTPQQPQSPSGSDIKISIITACQNSVGSIDDCLDSVQAQCHALWEHIVIDGASHDGSLQRLNHRREQLTLVYGAPNEGIYKAWNRGIGQADGEVLGFLNADDTLDNDHVLAHVADMFQDPRISAVYGNVKYVNHEDPRLVVRHLEAGVFSRDKLARGWAPPTTALFVRRSWYRRIGGFARDLPLAADYDASLRLFSQPFFKPAYLPEPLVRKRLHPWRPAALGRTVRRPLEEWKALRQAKLGGLATVAWKNITKVGLYL